MKFTFAIAMFLGAAMAAPADSAGAALSPRDPAMNAVAVMKSETKFADQVSQLINQHGAQKRNLVERETAEMAQMASQAQQAAQAVQALAANKALVPTIGETLGQLIRDLSPLLGQVATLLENLLGAGKRDESALTERAGGDLLSGVLGLVTNLLNGLLGGLLGGGSPSSGGSGSGTSLPNLDIDSILGSLTGAAGSGSGSGSAGSFPDIASTISSLLGGASKRDVGANGLLEIVSKLISTIAVDVKDLKPAAEKFAEAAELAKQVAESHIDQKA